MTVNSKLIEAELFSCKRSIRNTFIQPVVQTAILTKALCRTLNNSNYVRKAYNYSGKVYSG